MIKWVKELLREMFPITLFFFIAFTLVDIGVILRLKTSQDISYSFLVILVSSLLMAKVVLLSDTLSIIHAFSKKPLLYSSLWQTFIYVVCSFFVRFLERFVPACLKERSFEAAAESVIPAFTHLLFWVSEIWLAVLLFIFVASRGLIRAIGKEKVKELFFGK